MNEDSSSGGGFLLTGGSGLVGRALAAELARREIRVVHAVRSGRSPQGSPGLQVAWQPKAAHPFASLELLEGLDVAVNLSGANLAARRWTTAYKEEIVSSRTETTAALARTLSALERPPRLLISASATGIYGDRGNEVLAESASPGKDFLSRTCVAWESATAAAEVADIRVVHLRFGVVLDPAGGALAKVLPLFRAGLGGRLGSGQQFMSWIAIGDLVRAVLHIAGVDTGATVGVAALAGPVNCVTPAPVTNAEYTHALAKTLHRPALAAAPAFALRMALGEMADAALLASCRAVPEKLLGNGFIFHTPEIGQALTHLLRQ